MPKRFRYICIMKPVSSLYKGSLNLIILKMLEEEGRMYGYEITQKAKELTKGAIKISEGALYPALHKLEAEGLLTVSMEQIGNRLRKYYQLTPGGKKEKGRLVMEFNEFVLNLQHILKGDVYPASS